MNKRFSLYLIREILPLYVAGVHRALGAPFGRVPLGYIGGGHLEGCQPRPGRRVLALQPAERGGHGHLPWRSFSPRS